MRFVVLLVAAFLAAPLLADETARIEGEVVTQDSPLPGCTVRLSSDTFSRTIISDADGQYVFANIPPGTYDLSIELAGLSSVDRRITAVSGRNVQRDELKTLVTEEIIFTCGSPCAGEPQSEWDRPSCAEYDLNNALIEALDRSDRSALTLLREHHRSTRTYRERHRIAGALLRRVSDDSAYWNELLEHATNVVRFARMKREHTPEFVQWCTERQWKPDDYWYMAQDAFAIAGADRRARPLLHRALASDDDVLVMIAIQSLGFQRDHASLPAIEQTLQRLGEDAYWLAVYLSSFASEEADRLAMKYLSEDERPIYEEARQPR